MEPRSIERGKSAMAGSAEASNGLQWSRDQLNAESRSGICGFVAGSVRFNGAAIN